MVKAKDLLKKSPSDLTSTNESEQEKVSAAYEDITKRLAKLRGESEDDEKLKDEPEEEVEEVEDDEKEDDEKIDDLEDMGEEEVEKKEEIKKEASDILDQEEDEGLTEKDIDQENQKDEQKMKVEEEVDSDLSEDSSLDAPLPRKTFEKSTPPEASGEPRQFKTHNINMPEDEPQTLPPKPATEQFDSLDDLADEDDVGTQGSNYPPNQEPPSQRPTGFAQRTLQNPDEDFDIPQANRNSQRPRYSFYDPKQEENQPTTQNYPPRQNRNNISPFGGDFSSHRNRGSKSSVFQLIILLLIGAAVIGGTVYFLKNQFNSGFALPFLSKASPTPNSTPVTSIQIPTPLPTPTPLAIDRSNYKVRILNGTGKTGLAASVSAKLKDLGYKVERTGNATNSAFLKTVVRVKENQASLSGQLVNDLFPDYAADISVSLKASDPSDGEIILGEK